ncbi:MAG: hypothetical protein GY697_02570, partial [Desulfobacterales bacterium]|nr:hypothetical protein [Desulfobacterales bacterium]
YHTVALKEDNNLWAWGDNLYGQLGDGTTAQRNSPQQISNDIVWKSISAGAWHSLALTENGTLWAWGYNNRGQLGDDTAWQELPKPIVAGCGVSCQWLVTSSAGDNGSIRLSTAQMVNSYETTSFEVIPDEGYTASVGGTCGGSLVGTTYITKLITANCTVEASFAVAQYTVTPSAGNSGSISLSATRAVYHNQTTNFTVTPDAGYTASVGGTCGGDLVNGTYTTYPITADCTVEASFILNQYTVTPSAGENGLIDPSTDKVVTYNQTTSFEVIPDAGYTASVGGTCGGELVNGTYTTDAITADCTVVASFFPPYTVTPSAGDNGSINPPTDKMVTYNQTTNFTVTPDAGYTASVGGTCGGELVNGTYTTDAITADCTVVASFLPPYTVTPSAGDNGLINPSIALTLYHNQTTDFTVTPNLGYTASVGGTCDGNLVGTTYTTNGITANCTVEASFTKNIGFTTVAAGEWHSVGIKTDGTLWTWGRNRYGQLGDGTEDNYGSPEQIGSESDWESISVGKRYTVALKTDGTLWAWGDNDHGQLGDGTEDPKSSPQQIGNDEDWEAIIAGVWHSVGIKTDGTLWAWGANHDGELGDGTKDFKSSPQQIGNDTDWKSATAGDGSVLALKTDGTLWAWGENRYGQLGLGTVIEEILSPQQIGDDTDWEFISAGYEHTQALKTDGTLWTWGQNRYGQLGDGTVIEEIHNSPQQIGDATDWGFVSGGVKHGLALKTDGALWGWGFNSFGMVGVGMKDHKSPQQAGNDMDWKSIRAGTYHTVALKTDGTLWAWGENDGGQLGDGTTFEKGIPTQIGNDEDWKSISIGEPYSTGESYTVALKTNGTLWAWGYNGVGQLGDGTEYPKSTPTQIGNDEDWESISAGESHTVALKTGGTLWTWGGNIYSQLGDGTKDPKSSPQQIGNDADWESISAGGSHTVALKTGGTLWAWGWNKDGQLGDGTTFEKGIPTQIGNEEDWESISAGKYHTLALKTGGTLWAWGENDYGQLGDGTENHIYTPTQIGSESDWESISAGAYHTVAVKTGGALWAWGQNYYGQLGDGTMDSNSSPQQIGISENWESTSAGGSHTVALKADGTLWAWGENHDGQLGVTPYIVTSPTLIVDGCSVSCQWLVRPSAGYFGSIGPSGDQQVNHNQTTSFEVIPDTGYIASVGGTCGGSLVGTIYTTDAITAIHAGCTVIVSFIPQYTVTPSAGENGSIDPPTDKVVNSYETTSFEVIPDAGYTASVGGTCGGNLDGIIYTTNVITADCTVIASFIPNQYTITPSAGDNGSIGPSTDQMVTYNQTMSFEVTPETGYTASVGGTCGGSLDGIIYTTNVITADCTVIASFALAQAQYTITPSAGDNGSIGPSTDQMVTYNQTMSFEV